MIRTDCYLSILERMQIENPNAMFVIVTRARRNSVLSPSWELLNAAKAGKINWDEYSKRFIEEIMARPTAIQTLLDLKRISQTKDVFLVCYEKDASKCHRSLLAELIKRGGMW